MFWWILAAVFGLVLLAAAVVLIAAAAVDGLISLVAAKAEQSAQLDTEYLDEETGLLRCRNTSFR